MEIKNLEKFACPTCDGYIPNNQQIGEYSGALSRRQKGVEICSACGVREALEDFEQYLIKEAGGNK